MNAPLDDFTRKYLRKRIGDCLADLDEIPGNHVSGKIVAVKQRLSGLFELLAEPAPAPVCPEMQSMVEDLPAEIFIGGERGRLKFLDAWLSIQSGEFERKELARHKVGADLLTAARDIARGT